MMRNYFCLKGTVDHLAAIILGINPRKHEHGHEHGHGHGHRIRTLHGQGDTAIL